VKQQTVDVLCFASSTTPVALTSAASTAVHKNNTEYLLKSLQLFSFSHMLRN